MRTQGGATRWAIIAIFVATALSHGSARATDGGWISGLITDVHGAPLAGACVTVSPEIDDEEPYAVTGADGRYRLGPLPEGTYRVELGTHWRQAIDGSELCGLRSYRPQWFPGGVGYEDATPVSVNDGGETSGIDGTLPRYGRIEGRVTGPDGEPLSGACVRSSQTASTRTRSDGTYTLHVAFPDERVLFSDCGDARNLVPEVYPNQPARTISSFDDLGEAIEVYDEGLATGIDAQLARASTIHVHIELAVEDPDPPEPSLLEPEPPPSRSVWVGLSVDETREAGVASQPHEYEEVTADRTFTHLAPGMYWLRSEGHVGSRWFYEWHDGSETIEEATPLVLGQEQTLEVTIRIIGRQGCAPDDREEDWDDDGLTNCAERRLGTAEESADPDSDGLIDPEEVFTYLTDPFDADTDGDGFGDGFEAKGGTCRTFQYEGGSDPDDFWSTPIAEVDGVPVAPPSDRSARLLCG